MKKKLVSLCTGLLLAGVLLSSCNKDSGLTNPTLPMKTGGGSTPANPAVVYLDGSSYLSVMDSDGTHQTELLHYATPGGWSPGNSVLVRGWSNDNFYDTLFAIDVSVNSNGVPVASNYRVLVSKPLAATDSLSIRAAAWSATSSTNKIAFATEAWRTKALPLTVYLVSATGGAWNSIRAFPNGYRVESMTWKSDDSKIALLIDSTNSTWQSVVVIDASTGATTDSIPLSFRCSVSSGMGIEWSRSGSTNLLSFQNSSNGQIYYLNPTTGSTPSTNGVVGTSGANGSENPTWSPNNSTLMYSLTTTGHNGSVTTALKKVTRQTSSTTTVQSSFPNQPSNLNWHR